MERALRKQGLLEARRPLDRQRVRDELDEIGRLAQAAKQQGLTSEQALQEARNISTK